MYVRTLVSSGSRASSLATCVAAGEEELTCIVED